MFNFLKKKSKFAVIKSILGDHLKQLEDKKTSMQEDIFDVTRFFIKELIDIYESMEVLMGKNNFTGCIKLSRSILENSIELQYIYKKDIENRAKNFKLASVNKLSKKFDSLEDVTPEAKDMNDFFQELLKNYVPENKNIWKKFQEVNADSVYRGAYKRLSEYIHPVYRVNKVDFSENRPLSVYMRRLVFSDTCLVVLSALTAVCARFDLDGGIMMIDDPGYKGVILFATNPKKAEEDIKKHEPQK